MTTAATPEHAEILEQWFDDRKGLMRVALPGRVESYDPAAQRANVQPLVMDGAEDDKGARVPVRLPVVTDVPVVHFGSGPIRITIPINVGDTVLLVFCSSSLDRWLVRGGEVDPEDDRHHHTSDAIAIPGLFDFAHVPGDAPQDAMVLHSTAAVPIKLGDSSATDAVLKGDAFLTALDTLITAIATNVGTSGSPAGATAAGTAIGVAKTTFDASAAAAKSTKVKVS